MRRLPLAVLLDLDDTILDDTGPIPSCWLDACLAHQSDLGALDARTVYDAIERVRAWYWSDPERHRLGRLDMARARCEVVEIALDQLGAPSRDLARVIGDRYHALREMTLEPFADAVDTIHWLRERGCRLALLTNGGAEMQRRKVDRFGLSALFDTILIEGELGFGKPDPRVYARALDSLDAKGSEAWMVGDNLEWDVAQPQRHGIYAIWMDVRGAGLPPGQPVRPDRIIQRLSELRDLPAQGAEHD